MCLHPSVPIELYKLQAYDICKTTSASLLLYSRQNWLPLKSQRGDNVNRAAGFKSGLRSAVLAAVTLGLMGGNIALAQAAGPLDPTFGSGGTVTTTFTGAGSPVMIPYSALEQPNGDIVVLSQFDFVNDFGTQIGLTRYTSAGVLDTTFGTKGSVITKFSFTFDPFAFALEPNGDFLVAGSVGNASGILQFGLTRFTAAGVLDTTFGTDGVATTAFTAGSDGPSAFLLQPNGQALMGGFLDGGKTTSGSLSLVRFNSNGTLDATFGTAGVALFTGTIAGPNALAQLSNGDYLAVGENSKGANGTVVEISSTGVLQPTVNAGTLTATSPLNSFTIFPTLFESNGNFLVCVPTAPSKFVHEVAVSLYSEAGVKSTTFASTNIELGGKPDAQCEAMAVQANGQVIVGGDVLSASPIFGGLDRLDTNGVLDTTFGSGGIVATDGDVEALLIDANGNIDAIEGTGNDAIVVARYLAN
jgi:uncharacterized delta-60 repeat protein